MATQNSHKNDQDDKFEKDAVDPASKSPDGALLKTRDDKREHNIDANMSISEMREGENNGKGDKLEDQTATEENGPSDDAMNYKSDREHGSYNSKNI